ncbi:MAG: phage tail protein [Clostridia bacterium]|nr:phage tail protein [Clostridia bacterium]MBR0470744.1 phage tail protein [Clostridia bacterium]
MEYIHIFDRNTTTFEGNGKAVLNLATDIHIAQEINGDYGLWFKHPIYDHKMQFIQPEAICKYAGQLFRIKSIQQGDVIAKAIYTDAGRKHLQYIEDIIGETPYNIMVRLFRDTPVHILSPDETHALGMEWVTEKTDFFEVSKISPVGAMQMLTAQLEKQKANCELYIDNYNLALVRSIGSDNAKRISLNFNAKEITSELDSSALTTRMYPYGMDDLDISTVNGGKQYIDSPYINTFGIIENYCEFGDCEDPEELLELARWQFSPDNLERIDVPKYSLQVKYVDAAAVYMRHALRKPKLGDRVTVFDEQTGTNATARIVKTDIYPQSPEKSTIEVGQALTTFQSFLGTVKAAAMDYRISTNSRNQTKTSCVEMMRKNKRVTINNALKNQRIGLYDTGALFESPDGTCAVAIINGMLAIAAGKTGGEWDWTTVIDDNEVVVSEVFTGALYTNMCSVLSENGKLIIEDSLITMKDKADVTRFECGYTRDKETKEEKYVFCLYNAKGNRTVYINDEGEAVFAGKLSTSKNADVGSNLTVGKNSASGRIDFAGMINQSEGSIEVVDHEMNIEADYVFIKGMNVVEEIKKLQESLYE